MTMTTGTDIQDTTTAIEKALELCSIDKIRELPVMRQTMAMARGMFELRKALPQAEVEGLFCPLQGTSLGFRTDKDSGGGYDWKTVRDCVIEAMIRGFRPIGNEFNIISGRAYFTKEGYDRITLEFAGLTDRDLQPGSIEQKGSVALVSYHGHWKLNGEPQSLICDVGEDENGPFDRRIPVRLNSGMGPDAVLGKAKRKFLARMYEKLSGMKAVDGDIGDTIETTGEPVRRTSSEAEPSGRAPKDIPLLISLYERAPGQDALNEARQLAESMAHEFTAADKRQIRQAVMDAKERLGL